VLLGQLARAGVGSVSIAIGYLGQLIRALVDASSEADLDLTAATSEAVCGAFLSTLSFASALPSSTSWISRRIATSASQKRSSSSFGSLSVGSTIIVPGTGNETVGAWNP